MDTRQARRVVAAWIDQYNYKPLQRPRYHLTINAFRGVLGGHARLVSP
jgi:hypothetical protein